MINILIFGTGSGAEKIIKTINRDNYKIIAYIDNDKRKQGEIFNDKLIISPEEIVNYCYDKILIASIYTIEIYEQLLKLNIESNDIIPMYPYKLSKKIMLNYYEQINDIISNKPLISSKKKKIGLVKCGNSGSNTLALYKNVPQYISEKYIVTIVERDSIDINDEYDLICLTTQSGIFNKKVKVIQLWHGVPLKKIGMRTELFSNSYNEIKEIYTDKIISYSEFYSTLYNASFPSDFSKYEICGMPRNDLLFNNNRDLLIKIFGEKIKNKKIITYLPTYRKWAVDEKTNGNRNWNNIFGFENYNLEEFVNFLRNNNFYVISKLHPMESNLIDVESYIKYKDVIGFLEEEILNNNDIDLYEILANTDILITDYSSVYFDFLLLNKPMIFTPIDLDNYCECRGLNMEPYDFWTPGYKVYEQEQLQKVMKECVEFDKYCNEREVIKNIIHKYKDDMSSQRVWKIIDELL